MSAIPPLGPALPPAIDAFQKRALIHGAAPVPLVELNARVPGLGPFVMDHGGMFALTVYSGPAMHFSASPKIGGTMHAVA